VNGLHSLASRAFVSARRKDARTRHFLLLGAFAPLFLTVMLADQQAADEGSYVRFAHNLADGYYTHRSAPDLWFGPGLPLLLAPLAFVHAPLGAMRLLGPLLLLLAVILFYELLRLRVAPRVALAGAAALGLYVPFYVLLPTLHSDILAVFLVVLFMYALTRDLRERRARYLLVGAAALAFLALSRVVFGWIILAGLAVWFGVWLVRRDERSRRLALVHALAIVLCTPWLAYTYSISHNVFYWASSGGSSVYWMAAPYPGHLGDWQSRSEVFTEPDLAPNRPEFAKLRGLNQIESDEVLRHDAIHLIRTHPKAYARHLAENLSRIWFNTPYSFTPQKLSTLFFILPNALLLAGLLGVAPVLWLRRGTLPFEVGAFLVMLLLGVGVQALLAANGRMLAPLVPLILWLVVFVLARHVQLAPFPSPTETTDRA
jgi:4-amino-4-deoxy-L-arabinose transferase-like glycosyltransferase